MRAVLQLGSSAPLCGTGVWPRVAYPCASKRLGPQSGVLFGHAEPRLRSQCGVQQASLWSPFGPSFYLPPHFSSASPRSLHRLTPPFPPLFPQDDFDLVPDAPGAFPVSALLPLPVPLEHEGVLADDLADEDGDEVDELFAAPRVRIDGGGGGGAETEVEDNVNVGGSGAMRYVVVELFFPIHFRPRYTATYHPFPLLLHTSPLCPLCALSFPHLLGFPTLLFLTVILLPGPATLTPTLFLPPLHPLYLRLTTHQLLT